MYSFLHIPLECGWVHKSIKSIFHNVCCIPACKKRIKPYKNEIPVHNEADQNRLWELAHLMHKRSGESDKVLKEIFREVKVLQKSHKNSLCSLCLKGEASQPSHVVILLGRQFWRMIQYYIASERNSRRNKSTECKWIISHGWDSFKSCK